MDKFDGLNSVQREAVEHTEGPLLILAGAGSGKTRVLTHRVAYLIEKKNVKPWNIMAITFTNKAADEMRQRVSNIVDRGGEYVWVATFHSTCVRILRRFIDLPGYRTDFTIYDTDDQKHVIKEVLKRMELDPKLYPEKAVLAAISSAKNIGEDPDTMEMTHLDFRTKQMARIYREYQEQLRKNNALDFDDLLLKTVELLESNPEVLDYYQEKFQYIMVDEYQDTNKVQFRLIELLADKYRNICVVGDDDQSIYKFRGADITNILGFENVYPDAKVVKLEQNYRSTGNILSAANSVIRNNTERKEKKLWTAYEAGEKVRVRIFDSGYEEADAIIGEIDRMVRRKEATFQDFAILFRTNNQSRAFEEKCIAMSVPYRVFGGVNFYQRAEVKDILAYLKTIESGRDDVAVKRIINVPKRGIGNTSVEKINTFALMNDIDFFDALTMAEEVPGLGKTAAKVDAFVRQIQVMRSKFRMMEDNNVDALPNLLKEICSDTGYMDELMAQDPATAQTKKENVEELINKAVDFAHDWFEKKKADSMNPELREASAEAGEPEEEEKSILTSFLEEVALVADVDSLEQDGGYVVLMTLHGAKGLEFPYVFMVGMEEDLFPSSMAIDEESGSGLEEERRLCYVGITRARKRLVMTAAKMRTVRGETSLHAPSRFLEELPQDEVEFKGYKKQGFGKTFGGAGSWSDSDDYENEDNRGSFGSGFGGGFGSSFGNSGGFDRGYNGGYNSGFGGGGFRSSGSSAIPSPKSTPTYGKTFVTQKSDTLDYGVGDRVKHSKFGEGEVVSITDGKKDYEVEVAFDKFGVKRMFASFAKLTKI